jgi:lysylphosphatidylglycerol synthetase-like protein (DUF2156 family)
MVFLYGFTGFYATHSQFTWNPEATAFTEAIRNGILIISPEAVPSTRYAARFLTSVQAAGWIARIYILILLLRPVILHDRLEAPAEDIARIFRRHGSESVSAFAIQADKHHLLVAKGEGFVAYASKGSIALACGDPLAPEERFADAVRDYVEHCQRHGWAPCIYMAAERRLPVYHKLKMFSQQVADEAIIDLASFSPAVASPRAAAVHRYDRSRAADPLIDEQLEEVTEDWLETRHMREMGFTSGHFSLESLSAGPVFILGSRERVEAFCAWITYKNGRGVVLDLVRQRRGAAEGAVHILLVHALTLLKTGYDEASLLTTALDRREIETLDPRWEPRYLIHPRGADITRITRALAAIQRRS